MELDVLNAVMVLVRASVIVAVAVMAASMNAFSKTTLEFATSLLLSSNRVD